MAKVTRDRSVDSTWPRVVGILLILATLWYLPWVFANLNRQALWLSLPFAAASVMTALTTVITVINHWHLRVPKEHVAGSGGEPVAAVIIPTYGEPPAMVSETARSVLAQDYPLDKIRLIISDDAHRDGIRLVVQRLREERPGASVFYHEPPRRGDPQRRGEAKAGNLNSALDALQTLAPGVEFVETRDADDRVGDPAFLRKTIGQLQADPKTAFVQTIKEAVTSSSDPFGNLEPLFYRRAMLARHAANAVFPCGSGLVWRLAALDDIGGFPTWNLVEDLQSGVEALRRGWRGVYLPIVGAVAQAAPEDIPNTIKQRGTWALDTMRLIFWGKKQGLNAVQRLQFVELGLFYLVSFSAFVFAVTPVFPLLFGIYPLTTNQAQYALHFWPYAAAIELLLITLAWGLPYEALWRSRQMWLGLAPVYMRATILALRLGPNRKPSYRVTRKDRVYAWYWKMILPQLGLLVLLLVAAGYHLMTHPLLSAADLGSLFWAGFFAVGLSRIVRNSWNGVGIGKRLPARSPLSPSTLQPQAFGADPAATQYEPAPSGAQSLAPSPELPILAADVPRKETISSMEQDISAKKELRRRGRRTGYWLLATAAVVLAVALTARWAYYRWWQPMTAQQAELQQIKLSSQAGWEAATGDYTAAEQSLSTLLAANPADQVAQGQMAEVQRQVALSAGYAQVQEAFAQEDWQQADKVLQNLAQLQPENETVLALQALESALQARSVLFQRAEEAYHAGEWTEASLAYETLHEWDARYQEQAVVAHLADAYVRRGITLVESTRGDTGAVQQAIQLYQQALSLQPQQERARSELALAEKYLEGKDLLAKNDVQGALRAWQSVVEQNPNYAAGGLAAFLGIVSTPPAPAAPGTGSGVQ